MMNLTSSTLFGICSPTSPVESDRRSFERGVGYDELSTPWGTGAETPARRRPGLDEETYKLMKNRSTGFASSGLSLRPQIGGKAVKVKEGGSSSSMGVVLSLVLRGVLLFALGMGYGVLVTRLPHRARGDGGGEDGGSLELNWGYLTFWGGAGVALGCLLPWFDQVWEETFGKNRKRVGGEGKGGVSLSRVGGGTSPRLVQDEVDQDDQSPSPSRQEPAKEEPQARADTDWALVIRGIGAFVGIVFAIRRLPWTSTMQVSLTLALANPILWYLIDRSKPGFLLSAAVGVVGSLSILVLGVGGFAGGVLPAPFSASAFGGARNMDGWGLAATGNNVTGGSGNSQHADQQGQIRWFASQENIEAGIWILALLFCSCVCFGNIGRRLALNRSAAARGRWGGVR